MEDYQSRWEGDCPEAADMDPTEAARFLIRAITATIYSSGENYERALDDFFVQLEALGVVIGAADIEEVSAYMRRECFIY